MFFRGKNGEHVKVNRTVTKKKKGKKAVKIILLILLTAFLVFNVAGLIRYLKLKAESEKYLKKTVDTNIENPVDVVGLMDCFGVPYDEKVSESFMEKLENDLDGKGKLNSSLDLFNLYANKTWQFNGLFQNGVTIGEFYRLQTFSADFTRHKYPDNIKQSLKFESDEKLKDMAIYNYVASLDRPVVVYSCSANDYFYYFNCSPESLTPAKLVDIVKNFRKESRAVADNVAGNIETVLACNPDARILVLGLYMPADNYFLHLFGDGVMGKVNGDIRKACEKYENVTYIDLSCCTFNIIEGDFHPDANGQQIIAVKLAEALNAKPEFPVREGEKNEKEFVYELSDAADLDVQKIHDTMTGSGLPLDDYVECAVAFEWTLYECELFPVITFLDIEKNYDAIADCFEEEKRQIIKDALDVEIAEKKMLYGIVETDNALNPEEIVNDKMSLIRYYGK